jgi:hypothetical protein
MTHEDIPGGVTVYRAVSLTDGAIPVPGGTVKLFPWLMEQRFRSCWYNYFCS